MLAYEYGNVTTDFGMGTRSRKYSYSIFVSTCSCAEEGILYTALRPLTGAAKYAWGVLIDARPTPMQHTAHLAGQNELRCGSGRGAARSVDVRVDGSIGVGGR